MPETGKKPKYYWDACVFIHVITGVELSTLEPLLTRAQNKTIEICTSLITIAEVAATQDEKESRRLDPVIEDKIDTLWLPSSPVKLVEVFDSIVFQAKSLMRQAIPRGWSLKPYDAIHLATAQVVKVDQFHSYDRSLSKYSSITDFEILKPTTLQRSLFENSNGE